MHTLGRVSLASLLVLAVGCSSADPSIHPASGDGDDADDASPITENVGEDPDETIPPPELASRSGTPTFETATIDLGDGPFEATVAVVDGRKIFEGDIFVDDVELPAATTTLEPPPDLAGDDIPDPSSLDEERSVVRKKHRWPSGILSFVVSGDLPNANRVHAAMRHWRDNTKIRFKAARAHTRAYVEFVPTAGGCATSKIGYTGKRITIGLGPECTRGNVIHEIGHALGLLHEQSRPDRDKHVVIHWKNIVSGYEPQFYKASKLGLSVIMPTKYDKESIMHYPWNAFAIHPNRATISAVKGARPSGQRRALTKRDIAGIDEAY